MDIDILLILQEFRNSIGDALTPFLEWLSLFAVTYLPAVPAFLYWAVNKKKGLFALASYYVCVSINAVVKLTACVYRPWIRDDRIMPAGDAIRTATGYSFPSGHTATAGPIYGAMAVSCRKKYKWLSYFLMFLILLTMFSRLYLGVHTPQDVIVGMSEGFIMTFLIAKAYRYTDEHPESMDKFLLGGAVLAAAGMVYIMVKPYPMTYVDGALLVDPVKMRYDGLQDISALIMVMAAVYVDKKWIQYQPVEMKGPQIVIVIAGGAGLYWVITYLKAICIGAAGPEPGRVLYSFLSIFYIMVLVPFVLKMSASKEAGLQEVGAAE